MYTQATVLTTPTGNNAFSYEERMRTFGKAEITLPSIKHITHIDKVMCGNTVVFEEQDYTGKIRSCTGLQHIYHIQRNQQDIYIFDNHNHALYFWIQYIKSLGKDNGIHLLHVDQHSDLNTAPTPLDTTQTKNDIYVREYVNHICNVGNFIPPFLEAYERTNFERIKSEAELLEYIKSPHGQKHTILDIDLDFRAPEMSIQNFEATVDKIKEISKNASLLTIATSPYFLHQEKALSLLSKVFNGE